MAHCTEAVGALLSFQRPTALDFGTLLRGLASDLSRAGLGCSKISQDQNQCVTLGSETIEMVIAKDAPFNDALSIRVSTANDVRADVDAQLKACYLATRRVAGIERPLRIYWDHTRKSYSASEFLGDVPEPRRMTGNRARAKVRNSLRPTILTGDVLEAAPQEEPLVPTRPINAAAGTVPPKIRKQLPPLNPNKLEDVSRIRDILHAQAERAKFSNAISYEPQIPQGQDIVHRLTVHALCGILLVMAFPVGMAALIFNILGGENIRSTAHVIALTGTAIALSDAGMLDSLHAFF